MLQWPETHARKQILKSAVLVTGCSPLGSKIYIVAVSTSSVPSFRQTRSEEHAGFNSVPDLNLIMSFNDSSDEPLPAQTTDSYLEPILPPELEHLIVSIAAQDIQFTSTPFYTCANIQLTSRRFHDWIQPFLFRILDKKRFNIHLRRMGPRFIDNLRHLGKYTTHLAYTLDGNGIGDDPVRLRLLIECCPNLADLAIWHTSDTLHKVHEAVSKLSNLKRLSANFTGLDTNQILSPTYLRLTHLDLLGGIEDSLIQQFQNLTHLCINYYGNSWKRLLDRVTDKQAGCPGLRVIVSICDADDIQQYDDMRYVPLIEWPYYEEDWSNGADGGVDAWEFSERIVIARQRGYLLNPSRKAFKMLSFRAHKELTSEGQRWWHERNQGFKPIDISSDDGWETTSSSASETTPETEEEEH